MLGGKSMTFQAEETQKRERSDIVSTAFSDS
jgi:hypothetical protein